MRVSMHGYWEEEHVTDEHVCVRVAQVEKRLTLDDAQRGFILVRSVKGGGGCVERTVRVARAPH